MDARPWRGDGVADGKYPSLLEDFQTGTASIARKRHLTSIARGLFGFCLAPSIRKLISTDERVPFFPSVEVKEKGYKL